MSSTVYDKPLSPDDLAMLRRVLDAAALQRREADVAALLIIRLFQSGITAPANLSVAIARFLMVNSDTGAALSIHRRLVSGDPFADEIRAQTIH